MDRNIDNLKNILIQYLSNKDEVVFAFLYGSYSKGTFLKDSDLDLAIYFKEGTTPLHIDNIWDEIQKSTKKDVEVLVLNGAKAPIAWQALRGTRLVIKDWKIYLSYMLAVSSDAMDFQNDLEDMWRMKNRLVNA